MEDDGAYSSQNDVDRDYRRGDRRDRGAGRRRDRKPRDRLRRERDRPDRQELTDGADVQTPMKTPIILAKKTTSEVSKKEVPTILAIQRRTGYDGSPSPSSSKSLFTETYNKPSRTDKNGGSASPATPTQTPQTTPHIEPHVITGLAALKLPPGIYPSEAISLIDGSFQWSDRAFDTLLDQSDYVVVGCVGLQGAGKSTIMSMIAGQKIDSMEKTRLVFRPQKKTDLEKCIHRTVGIDMYVTRGRMILLDTQPLLSPSMLDQYLRYDRKVPAEYSTAELCLEVQALQILSFLYTVCHVVLVVQDYFTDINLLNLLKSAEMLKPSTVSHGNQDSSSVNTDDLNEYFPHICFLYTCCEGRTFESNMVHSMCEIHAKYFKASRLRIRGSASILRALLLPYHSLPQFYDYQDLNLFLLPQMNESFSEAEDVFCPISKFHGHPSLQSLVKVLRHQLLAMPREQFTHHQLSEKNWFHFAARTWEAVKKSNLIGEYHRLLTA